MTPCPFMHAGSYFNDRNFNKLQVKHYCYCLCGGLVLCWNCLVCIEHGTSGNEVQALKPSVFDDPQLTVLP